MITFYAIEVHKQVLINLGAKTIVVPGVFPVGCLPHYLAMFQSKSAPEDYDAFGCIMWLNDFSEYRNCALKRMLQQIPRNPTVTILYGDYSNNILEIIRHLVIHGKSLHGQGSFSTHARYEFSHTYIKIKIT